MARKCMNAGIHIFICSPRNSEEWKRECVISFIYFYFFFGSTLDMVLWSSLERIYYFILYQIQEEKKNKLIVEHWNRASFWWNLILFINRIIHTKFWKMLYNAFIVMNRSIKMLYVIFASSASKSSSATTQNYKSRPRFFCDKLAQPRQSSGSDQDWKTEGNGGNGKKTHSKPINHLMQNKQQKQQ